MNKKLSSFFCCMLIALTFHLPAAAAQNTAKKTISEESAVQALLIGYLLSQHNRYAEAARLVGDVGIAWQDSDALASAVKLSIQARNIEMAHKYAAAWAEFGGGTKARQTLAELHLLSGEWAQAEQVLSALMREKQQSNADLLQQLSILDNAEETLLLGKRLFADDADGLYHLALLALNLRQFPAAKEALSRVEATGNERLDILFLNARLRQLDDDVAPLALIQRYVDADCGGALRHCNLDAVLWAYGDYLRNSKQGEWRTRLQEAEDDAAAWAISAAHWYEQWEMPVQARAAYNRGGDDFMAQQGLARLAEDAGDITQALAILNQAQVKDSSELVTRETTIAYLLGEQKKFTLALARIETALQTVPNNFSLLYHQALLLEQSGAVEAAIATLRRLTDIYPDNPDSWNALGYVMADHNMELASAKQYIERALSTRPNDPNIIDSLGWVYYRLGDLEAAARELKRAVELSESPEILAHYGEVLWEIGNTGQAKTVWQEAKQVAPDNPVLNETISRYNPF